MQRVWVQKDNTSGVSSIFLRPRSGANQLSQFLICFAGNDSDISAGIFNLRRLKRGATVVIFLDEHKVVERWLHGQRAPRRAVESFCDRAYRSAVEYAADFSLCGPVTGASEGVNVPEIKSNSFERLRVAL